MRATMTHLATAVESGSTFSEALAQHPHIFNKLYVNMVKAGELGGVLEIVLQRLAEFQEKAQKIKGKVKSAMVYPVVVLCIAMLILAFLLVFIVPKFQKIFHDALPGQSLPGITLFVIAASNILISQWYLVIGAIAVVVIGLQGLFEHAGRRDRSSTGWPCACPSSVICLSKTAISRFSRTLGHADQQRCAHPAGAQHHAGNGGQPRRRQRDRQDSRQREGR